MDRNDSNPGRVERQMDDAPMHGRQGNEGQDGGMHGRSGNDGEGGMHGASSDRSSQGMQGSPQEGGMGDLSTPSDRLGVENTSSNDAEMRTSAREGGYGYDRPTDMTVSRDDMQASSRDTDQGTDRVADNDTTPARDW